MDVFVDFLINNWRFVAEIALTLVVLLVAVFKKKTSITTDGLNKVLMALPDYIKEAERSYRDGKQKFEFVYNKAMSYLLEIYSSSIVKERGFDVLLVYAIENILATPQKKEEK